MRRPYVLNDSDDTMDMVGHNHEGIQQNMRKMNGQCLPAGFCHTPISIQTHCAVHHVSEKTYVPMGTDRDKIGARLPVIVIFQADGSTVMFAGVVGHRCVGLAHLASTTAWPAAKYSPRMRIR